MFLQKAYLCGPKKYYSPPEVQAQHHPNIGKSN